MKDGWHTIQGKYVYVENGYIIRAMKNNNTLPAYVYRSCRNGGWDIEEKITPAAFSAGFRRGTIEIF